MTIKTATKPTTLQNIDKKIFDAPLGRNLWGSVNLYRGAQKGITDDLRESYADLLRVTVNASCLNTTDLDAAENFAKAILVAIKEARQLNKEAGL